MKPQTAKKPKSNPEAAADAVSARPEVGSGGSASPVGLAPDGAGKDANESTAAAATVAAGESVGSVAPAAEPMPESGPGPAGGGDLAASREGPIVRISAKRDGFRRAGIVHAKTPTDHPAERFNEEQMRALVLDPMLKVQVVLPDGNIVSHDQLRAAAQAPQLLDTRTAVPLPTIGRIVIFNFGDRREAINGSRTFPAIVTQVLDGTLAHLKVFAYGEIFDAGAIEHTSQAWKGGDSWDWPPRA